MQTYTKTNEAIQINQTKRPRLSEILAEKLIVYVRENRLSRVFRNILEAALGLSLGALVVAPSQVLSLVKSLVEFSDFAIPKFALVLLSFFGRKTILRMFKKCSKFVQKRSSEVEKNIDNIPVPELVDYLIRNKHFKREGVNGVRETFGLNMKKFNRLAKKLEENEVLIRGENNGRILAPKWSRQALIDYLSGYQQSRDMQPRFKITRIGSNQKLRLDRDELEPSRLLATENANMA